MRDNHICLVNGNPIPNPQLFLQKLGFETVEYQMVDSGSVVAAVDGFEQKIEGYDVPSDGLVLVYDDIAYGQSLGTTANGHNSGIRIVSLPVRFSAICGIIIFAL